MFHLGDSVIIINSDFFQGGFYITENWGFFFIIYGAASGYGSGLIINYFFFFLCRVGSGYGSGLVIRESEFSGRVKCNAVLSVEFLENNLEITSRFCKLLRFFQIGDLQLRLKKLANSAACHRNLLIFFRFSQIGDMPLR